MPELGFRVTSFDPHTPPGALVSELIESMLPELTEYLRRKWNLPDLTLEADRQKSIPIDPATAYLVIEILGWAAAAGAGAIAAGFFQRMGEDIYEYLKARIRNGTIERPQLPSSSPTPSPQPPTTTG